ncbi:uncharacterized protein B0I36DRAFT_326888 [Microdochium trichocladiopsis]|uniref:Uncharacterized protein n=1 Tax=Microdochium trichocladiopsis TaxID=1682393 RepID=A0A9P8Y2M5_9PEZI|nr:uncharacterized protein B0I36DRAFT_326888 [Microdochium trichocladiopsis]KAH7027329.1 hypothetical protein B0I36DRAFT_326888 [Microdochium trichocladiopsis]
MHVNNAVCFTRCQQSPPSSYDEPHTSAPRPQHNDNNMPHLPCHGFKGRVKH